MRGLRPFMALLLAAVLTGCYDGSYGYQQGYAYPTPGYDYDYPSYGYAYPSPGYGYYPGYAYGPSVGLGFSYYDYNYGPSYHGGYYGHQGNWNNAQRGGSAPPAGQPPMQQRPTIPPGSLANTTTHSTHGGAETYQGRPYPWCPTCKS